MMLQLKYGINCLAILRYADIPRVSFNTSFKDKFEGSNFYTVNCICRVFPTRLPGFYMSLTEYQTR